MFLRARSHAQIPAAHGPAKNRGRWVTPPRKNTRKQYDGIAASELDA
jgi:hypothetical protein